MMGKINILSLSWWRAIAEESDGTISEGYVPGNYLEIIRD